MYARRPVYRQITANKKPSKAVLKKRAEAKEARAKNRGNWEYNFYMKCANIVAESNIKMSLKPDNGFNPKLVHQYINPEISKEEAILLKSKTSEKLTSREKIILQNYLAKQEEILLHDLHMLKTQGLAAKPVTKEGKTRFLLYILSEQIQKKNYSSVVNIYLKLMDTSFEITPEIRSDFIRPLAKMESIISSVDLLEQQFIKFHSQMYPLNVKGFVKFDDWQIKVIELIDSSISVVLNVPTSGGKTALAVYVTKYGKTLFVVPTDPLAWQLAAYVGHVLGTNVPIVTATYQTNPNRDLLIQILNKADAIVGTADCIVDYLPFLINDFKWLVFDEVHMIGKPEGSAMEHIIKILPNIPTLALSATIGNTDELVDWFRSVSPTQPIEKVICTKRFLNQERFYYSPETKSLVCLHPLSLIDESQIADESLLKKTLQPTPPNAWDLAMKFMDAGITELDPYRYFDITKRIELNDANIYFNKLIELLVEKYKTQPELIMSIVNSYKHEAVVSTSVNVLDVIFLLKSESKLPAICFQENTIACTRMVREFAFALEEAEKEKYPTLYKDRLKLANKARRQDKKTKPDDDKAFASKSDRKATKELMGGVKLKKDGYGKSSIPTSVLPTIEAVAIQEPHPDFNLKSSDYFVESEVEEWVYDLKKYYPNTGDEYHYLIKLLWRGVGVYVTGLPDPYLRLVQSLAAQKKLALVFSDKSLVFGISMPFKTVIIIRDEKIKDDLDPMLFHQMTGRAGRRGLDKEGNIIFVGYSWGRIKELSISEPPIVSGASSVMFAIPHANQISRLVGTNHNWDLTAQNFLDKSITDEDAHEFLEGTKSNYEGGWDFAKTDDNINHLYMNWKLRNYNEESLLASLLTSYLRKGYENKDPALEKNQIDIAHFLCGFFSTKETDNPDDALILPDIFTKEEYKQLNEQLDDAQIELPKMIDNKLFLSIQHNYIIKSHSEDATDKLRHRLMEFGEKIKNIQHYCFHSKIVGLSRLMGKLLTRIWWIYHSSSLITKPLYIYESNDYVDVCDSDEEVDGDEVGVVDDEETDCVGGAGAGVEYESDSETHSESD
jgi:hypothetical protein